MSSIAGRITKARGRMERVLVSRQPIYRADMAVLGYELLFRDSEIGGASFSDGDQATAEVILNTFVDIGLEEVVGQDLAFINFGRNLIMANYCEALPRERVVFELDRKSTRLNSSHGYISYAVFCLKKKKALPHVLTPNDQHEG